MYIQSDDISGVEGHELAWLQSDRYIIYLSVPYICVIYIKCEQEIYGGSVK